MGLGRRLLVTGAGGQLGRAVARILPEAVLFDRGALDVTDREAVLGAISAHRPEVLLHAAAYTKVDAAETDPEGAALINVKATEFVAEAARKVGALLIYPSTDYVFSGQAGRPYREEDETGPLSVYGKTKLEGENASTGAGRFLVVRTSWVFGEGHNFIRSILAAAKDQNELAVVDDQRGLPTYAQDLAKGILDLVEGGATGTFNLAGGGEGCTWADLAEFAVEAGGFSTHVRRITTAEYYRGHSGPIAPRPAFSVLDCSKAASAGVTLRSWKDAVSEFVKESI